MTTHTIRMMWLWIGAVLLGLSLLPGRALANPALTLSQPIVTIETGHVAQILVTADAIPAGARLVAGGDPGIDWSLEPRDRSTWILQLRPEPRLTSEASLSLQLVGSANQRLAAATLKLVPKPLPAPDAVVQATLMLDGGGLVEGRDSHAYLAITNKSEQALAVRRIVPLAGDEISLVVGDGTSLIPPRTTIVRPLTLSVAHAGVPRTGTHLVVLDLTLTNRLNHGEQTAAGGSAGAGDWSARVLVSKEIDLSVPGLTALQGVLQIPTLLLLPGLLAIIAFSAVLDLAKPRPIGENPLSRLAIALSPGLWVVVIMISGVIGLLYTLITQRDILYGLGIRDVVCLWFASLVAGGLAGWYAYDQERKRQRAADAPRFVPGIAPDAFLRQMVAASEPLQRRARLLGEQFLFDLGAANATGALWACGAIGMRALGARDDQVLAAMRSKEADTVRVAAILTAATAGKLALQWKPFIADASRIAEPQIVSPDLFAGMLVQGDILQELP